MERCLRRGGYEVKTALDGKSAPAQFMAAPVDVVVADWRMPASCRAVSYVTGCARCRGLADVAFILVSGEPSLPAFVSFDGFLRKPVDGAILLATMRRLLDDHVTHRALQRGGQTQISIARTRTPLRRLQISACGSSASRWLPPMESAAPASAPGARSARRRCRESAVEIRAGRACP